MHRWVADLLACWPGRRGNRSVKEVWRIAPLCLMWIVWREWNARCIEDQERRWMSSKRCLSRPFPLGVSISCFSVFYYASICGFLFFFLPLVGPFFVYILCTRVILLSAFNELLIYQNKMLVCSLFETMDTFLDVSTLTLPS